MTKNTSYTVHNPNAPMHGDNVRTFTAPNVRSAAEAYDTRGLLNMTGPDSVDVTAVVPGRVWAVKLTDGRTLTVAVKP